FLCDNDGQQERWVLKLLGLSATELAADWVGSLLAHRLGLPCPPVDIVNVSERALRTAPEDVQAWARPGPAFASKLVQPANSGLTDIDVVELPPEMLGTMYALDTWLEVLDRRKPDGIWNLLQDLSDASYLVLDFGKCLAPCLQSILGSADTFIEP